MFRHILTPVSCFISLGVNSLVVSNIVISVWDRIRRAVRTRFPNEHRRAHFAFFSQSIAPLRPHVFDMTEGPPVLDIPSYVPTGENPPPTITTPTAIIHSSYDLESVPPKPSTGVWTRFVCISDTHEHTFEVPHGDVLLHSGTIEFFHCTLCRVAHLHRFVINV